MKDLLKYLDEGFTSSSARKAFFASLRSGVAQSRSGVKQQILGRRFLQNRPGNIVATKQVSNGGKMQRDAFKSMNDTLNNHLGAFTGDNGNKKRLKLINILDRMSKNVSFSRMRGER